MVSACSYTIFIWRTRSKTLLVPNPHARLDGGNDVWLNYVTVPLDVTQDNLCTCGLSLLDHVDDVLSRSCREESAKLGLWEVRVMTSFDLGWDLLDKSDEFVGYTALDDNTFRGHARLSREEECTRYDSTRGIFEICVFENLQRLLVNLDSGERLRITTYHHGRFACELKDAGFEVFGGFLGNNLSDTFATTELHRVQRTCARCEIYKPTLILRTKGLAIISAVSVGASLRSTDIKFSTPAGKPA